MVQPDVSTRRSVQRTAVVTESNARRRSIQLRGTVARRWMCRLSACCAIVWFALALMFAGLFGWAFSGWRTRTDCSARWGNLVFEPYDSLTHTIVILKDGKMKFDNEQTYDQSNECHHYFKHRIPEYQPLRASNGRRRMQTSTCNSSAVLSCHSKCTIPPETCSLTGSPNCDLFKPICNASCPAQLDWFKFGPYTYQCGVENNAAAAEVGASLPYIVL